MSCAQIEERELNYYTNNALTVGTQAALLAGFAFTGIRIDEVNECPSCYDPARSAAFWEIDATQPVFLRFQELIAPGPDGHQPPPNT